MSKQRDAVRAIGIDKTAAEIRTILAADGAPLVDSTRYSYQGIARHPDGGQAAAAAVLLSFKAMLALDSFPGFSAGEWAAQKAMIEAERSNFLTSSADGSVGGLDFAQPERQATLTAWIAAADEVAAAELTKVKHIGLKPRKGWQVYGLPSLPSEESIEADRVAVDAAERWAHVRDDIVPPLLTAGASWAAIKAAVAGAE